MGAAMIKSCLSGDQPIDPPRRLLNSRHDASYPLSSRHLESSTCTTKLLVKSVRGRSSVRELPKTAIHLQDVKKPVVRSLRSETPTVSASSFDSVVSPIRRACLTGGSPTHSLLPPEYLLECVVGKGTTSTCYKCLRKTDGRHFACKIIEKQKVAPSARRRLGVVAQLRREVAVLQRVNHPHIAKLEESFEDDQYLILIMELLEGGELFDAIVERGCFSELEAIIVCRSILSAIQHMHKRDVMHRDLKPENMLLARSKDIFTIKIIDFGFAKVLKEGTTSTSFLGTGGYMAPEILLRQAYGTAVDMWSFGVLTYLLLCGRLPFAATTKLRAQQKIEVLYKLTFPRRYWRNVSAEAIDFLQRVLVLDPTVRLTATEALNHSWLRG
ncbi:hypothetical protein PsorP6_012226 [Peronosclerospora sorghi]|uniref:Uncharacterized protein n=1 Tax=Peronosclerospora sorghi TaxID=230839 RepID=A0ACC0WJM3_9STRA|nr:hypothetical protein PsorP6_012226 [Peronosclerospora sorghi]